MAKEKLSFYDVKSKAKFDATEYEVREKKGRYYAVTQSQAGSHECWRVISKANALEMGVDKKVD